MNKVPVIFEVNPDSKHQNDLAMMCLQWGGETHHLREYILKSLIGSYSHISAHTNKTVLNWAGVMLSMEANNNTSFPCVAPIFRLTRFPGCEGHLGFSLDTRGASLSAQLSQQQFSAV